MPKTTPLIKLKGSILAFCAFCILAQPPAVAAGAEDPGCRACLQSASGLFARGDNEGAAKLLTQWQTKCPNNLQLYLMLNTVLLRLPDGKKRALDAAEQACVISPNSMLAHFQKAMTLMQLQQGSSAAQEFQRVVELDPTSYESWLALSELLGAQGKAAAAKDAENHAAQLSPSARRSMLSTLASKDRAGNMQGLKQEVSKLMDDPNTSAETLLIVGQEVLRMGYFDAAADALNQARAKYPDAPQVTALLPFALFEAGKGDQSSAVGKADKSTAGGGAADAINGLKAISSGDFDNGQKLIEKATTGNTSVNLFAQGYLAMQSGRYKEAIEKLSDALAKNPDLTVTRIYVAQCNLQLGDLKEAISQAREAYQKASGLKVRAEAIELVARLRDGEDNGTNIAPLKAELVAYAPRLTAKDQALADAALGELVLRDKDSGRARELFNSALGHMPSCLEAQIGLGRTALSEGDAKSALGDLDRALAQAPGNVDALSLRAVALLQNGNADAAESAIAKASQEGELPAAACLALGQEYKKSGESKKAAKYLKQAMQAGLNGAALVQAKDGLKSLGDGTAGK